MEIKDLERGFLRSVFGSGRKLRLGAVGIFLNQRGWSPCLLKSYLPAWRRLKKSNERSDGFSAQADIYWNLRYMDMRFSHAAQAHFRGPTSKQPTLNPKT